MIDEKMLLRELDEMIKIQQKSVVQAEQESNETVVYLESRELAAYMKIRNMIKEKSAHGAATPLGTRLNKQEQYNTDQKKSKIRKEHKPDYATLLFLDDQNFVKEAENLKKD